MENELLQIPDFNKLMGRRVKTLRAFVNIPEGHTGTIVEIYEPFEAKYKGTGIKSCTIEWDGMNGLKDGFAPDELKYLKLI